MQGITTLVEGVRAGDSEAFAALVRRFQDMAVGYGYSLVGDHQLAEDVAQEAFFTAYLHLSTLLFCQISFDGFALSKRSKGIAKSPAHSGDLAIPLEHSTNSL